MADADRKHQIAAARKKLKQYKKTGTGTASPRGNDDLILSSTSLPRGRSPQTVQNSHPTDHNSSHINNNNNGVDLSLPVITKINNSGADYGAGPTSPHRHLTSSTESLHQLSRKVTDLITESGVYINGGNDVSHSGNETDDLERRNRELASLLDRQTQANTQLSRQLEDLKEQNRRLQDSVDNERKAQDDKLRRELGALKEQLQVHIQTIGILVSEKAELQSTLNQNTKTVEVQQTELEELSGRLKASRQRVTDLERNYSTANSASQKYEKTNKDLSKEVDKLKMDLYKLTKSNEEFQQHNLELQRKLQAKVTDSSKMEDDLIDLRGQLEMSQLHIQQLKAGGGAVGDKMDTQSSEMIEKLLSEKSELSVKLEQQEENVDRMRRENESVRTQYMQYMEQLQQQSQQLQAQVVSLSMERDDQMRRCQELETIILDLKAQHAATSNETVMSGEEKRKLLDQIDDLTTQLSFINKNLEAHVADNSQLGRLVIEKEQRIVELELTAERLSEGEVDKERLLETMQSDKSALSRAIAQNKELKNQLAELQNGFVKMSTDNMEMMTQLQNEQHVARELAARLGQQEDEIKELSHQLSVKEHELGDLQRRDAQRAATHRQELSSEEMEERIRDFQQQAPLIDSLQRELSTAQDTINALTNQNSELRSKLVHSVSSPVNSNAEFIQSQVESLSSSVVQLEMERNGVIERLREAQRSEKLLQDKLDAVQKDLAMQVPATLNGDVITKVHFEALQHAMKQLEEKYTRVMRDKADLIDKTERLEHINMQLQGETDTIGEYVSLYQQQRSILRQRTEEKDGYIFRLAHERIDMQHKLGQLQALVMQLLGERNLLHSYQGNALGTGETEASLGASYQGSAEHSGPSPPKRRKKHSKRHGELHERLEENNGQAQEALQSEDGVQGPQEAMGELSGGSSGSESETENTGAIYETTAEGRATVNNNGLNNKLHSPTLSQSMLHSLPHTGVGASYHHFGSGVAGGTGDETAHRIISLLNEIGTSNVIQRTSYDDRHFIHCNRCIGALILL